MDHMVLNLAGIVTTIAFSIALAVYLDWLALRGLMRLMPADRRAAEVKAVVTATKTQSDSRGSQAA